MSDDQNVTAAVHLSPIANIASVGKAKKADLLYMCRELIIPKDYHNFYHELPVENTHEETETSQTSALPVVNILPSQNCGSCLNLRKKVQSLVNSDETRQAHVEKYAAKSCGKKG